MIMMMMMLIMYAVKRSEIMEDRWTRVDVMM